MYPLTPQERAAERAERQADDASERLGIIKEARTAALHAIAVALLYLRSEAEAARMHGAPTITDLMMRETLEAVDESLGELVHHIVADLEDMELGEGRHDLSSLADQAAEDRADADRQERGR